MDVPGVALYDRAAVAAAFGVLVSRDLSLFGSLERVL